MELKWPKAQSISLEREEAAEGAKSNEQAFKTMGCTKRKGPSEGRLPGIRQLTLACSQKSSSNKQRGRGGDREKKEIAQKKEGKREKCAY